MNEVVDPRLDAVNALFERIAEQDGPAGVAFTVRRHGNLMFSRVIGNADDADERIAMPARQVGDPHAIGGDAAETVRLHRQRAPHRVGVEHTARDHPPVAMIIRTTSRSGKRARLRRSGLG